jgi:two-component SAPR family response regulator
VQISF